MRMFTTTKFEGTDLRPTRADMKLYFQAFVAIHGSIFLWVGFWDLLNEGVEE